MWLSRKLQAGFAGDGGAELGVTSIAGGSAGVVTRGEVRAVPVFGPGGYIWQPDSGETVLVIKGGPGGEETCVAGAAQRAAPADMAPGEVYIFSPGGAAVCLRRDGTLELSGGSIVLRGSVSVLGGLSVNGKSCNAGSGG